MVPTKDTPRDLVAILPLRDFTCVRCGDAGWLLVMEDAGPHCLTCVDLDHLIFLPAGDAALSRRARRASTFSAVVVKLSRSRRRYEREGILTGQRGSGRVGRSAAGRALNDNAITLSVAASVRHEDTEYDRFLMAGVPRIEARERVRPAVDRWRAGNAG